LKEDEQGLKQTIYATAGRRYQFGTRVFNRLLRNTALDGGCGDIIEGGLSARRKDSLFDATMMHVCVFLLTHATILIIMRNITHYLRRNLHTSTCLVFYRDYRS